MQRIVPVLCVVKYPEIIWYDRLMQHFADALLHFDPVAIIQAGGYVGIAALIFAESGLLIGIFFPGDSLLFAAGLLAGSGFLSFPILLFFVIAAAILGDSVGYWFGTSIGPGLFARKDSRFFKQAYLKRTEQFYTTYGGRAVTLARFVPIVRTLAPILAGVSAMPYRQFLAYNLLGGTLWGGGMVAVGYTLGRVLPGSEHYLLPFSLLVVAVSFLPFIRRLWRRRAA